MYKQSKLAKPKSSRQKKVRRIQSSKLKRSSNFLFEGFDITENDDDHLDGYDDIYLLPPYEIDDLVKNYNLAYPDDLDLLD